MKIENFETAKSLYWLFAERGLICRQLIGIASKEQELGRSISETLIAELEEEKGFWERQAREIWGMAIGTDNKGLWLAQNLEQQEYDLEFVPIDLEEGSLDSEVLELRRLSNRLRIKELDLYDQVMKANPPHFVVSSLLSAGP